MEKKYELPREFGEKWVKALRSGKYEEGDTNAVLRWNDCYCPLGLAGYINDFEFNTYGDTATKDGEDLYAFFDRITKNSSFNADIYIMWDSGKYTFNQIADWIEQNVTFI